MKSKGLNVHSIRAKLIRSFIAICIIPLIILGVASYFQSKSILSNKLNVTSTQTLSEVNSGLNDYFRGFMNMTSMASNNVHVVNVDLGDNINYMPDIVKEMKESDKDILDVYYGAESGKFSMYPEAKLPDGYDARQRVWYKVALEHKGKVVITPAYQDVGTGSIVVGIVKTVEKDGKVVGVIGLDCSLKALTEKVASKKIGNSGYVFFAEVSGNVLAHPNKDVLNTDAAAKLSIWDNVKSGKDGFVTYVYNGGNKFGAYKTNELTGWKIVATLDESELSSDTKSILITTFLIIFVMALISIAASVLLSRRIAINIRNLGNAFDKASKGDLTVSIEVKGKDEFKELGLSFNEMMKNILILMKNVTTSSNTVLETSTSLASMSEEITASIGEVAKAIEDVSSGATEQVENAQKGAARME